MSCLVRAPKLTSVPFSKWLSAKGCSALRPRAISGTSRSSSAKSVVWPIPGNRGWPASLS